MLLELAIGDAYGAGFEYADTLLVLTRNDLSGYVQHPKHLGLKPGMYTDDTQMSLAVAEALLSGQNWSRELLAEHFVRAFRRDPREGYAKGFYAFMTGMVDGAQLLAQIQPVSDKSGAAMRAPVLGLLPSQSEVLAKTELQARITHDSVDGVEAAQAAALAVHYCRYQLGALEELPAYLDHYVRRGYGAPWRGPVGEKGWMAVRAAVTALVSSTKMTDLLRACIAYTGDVDTVAAIALAAGAVCPAIQQDLPQVLHDGLETGPYGRQYLIDLDAKLAAAYPSLTPIG